MIANGVTGSIKPQSPTSLDWHFIHLAQNELVYFLPPKYQLFFFSLMSSTTIYVACKPNMKTQFSEMPFVWLIYLLSPVEFPVSVYLLSPHTSSHL